MGSMSNIPEDQWKAIWRYVIQTVLAAGLIAILVTILDLREQTSQQSLSVERLEQIVHELRGDVNQLGHTTYRVSVILERLQDHEERIRDLERAERQEGPK